MHKILVPIDGSDHALKALHIACDLADKYNAQICLLYVLAPGKLARELLDLTIAAQLPPKLRADLQSAAEKDAPPLSKTTHVEIAQNILNIAARRAKRRGIDTQIMPIAEGDAAENILMAQKLLAASTIVMGSRGGNFSTLSSFGSVSHAVFAKADCTCISVK